LFPGSSSLFYALHKVCLEDSKSPLVRVCLRKGSRASLAHLLPMLENMTGNVPINYFLLKYMPFQGECRDVDVAVEIIDKEDIAEVVEDAKNIIKKATCKFLQATFPNPKLNMFYSAVEALALNLDQPKEVIDHLGKT
jgi:Ku70/Ku80 beta-barrel domain/Ku70/Ku80 C-terminal arm